MPRRTSLILSIAAALCFALLTAPVARAQADQDQLVKEVENSKYSTTGIVNANAVFIRCGPGENYYPTMKLDKGAKVTVVGAKFDWLKIDPPQGSFCYVAKLYVDRHGDGKIGRVNKDSINVRAGSALSALKIGILCELRQNEEVTIIGEEQEYFKVLPPKGAYLYVSKKHVDPDPDAKPQVSKKTDQPKTENKTDQPKTENKTETANTTENKTQPADQPKTENKTETANNDTSKSGMVKSGTDTGNPDTNNSLTGNTPPDNKTADNKTPDNKTADTKTTDTTTDTSKNEKPLDAEALFDKANAQYMASRSQKLDEQPIDAMLKDFETLAKSDTLPESMRRICDARVTELKARQASLAELLKLREARAADERKRMALKAEQEEIEKRIADNAVQVYTAVGTLQPSSLQVGTGATLYRLTDPANGRTMCYLRTNDGKVISMLNRFVGVKGTMQEEQRLGAKVILPTEVTPCDQSKVFISVTAQLIPPSITPKQPAQASTDPGEK